MLHSMKTRLTLALAASLILGASVGVEVNAADATSKQAAKAAKQAAKAAKKKAKQTKTTEQVAADQATSQLMQISSEAARTEATGETLPEAAVGASEFGPATTVATGTTTDAQSSATTGGADQERTNPAVIERLPMAPAIPLKAMPVDAQGKAAAQTAPDAAAASGTVNLNDDKVTEAEKAIDEHNRKVSDTQVEEQAHAVNKIPGTPVNPTDLKEEETKKKGGFTLNPITWLFKPVIKLQEQSVRLEQQIMKLTGPIASLQPSMLGLQKKMDGVQGTMGHMQGTLKSTEGTMVKVDKRMAGVQNQMGGVQKQLTGMSSQVGGVRADMRSIQGEMSTINRDINQLREPITDLRDPLLAVQKPIAAVEGKLANLDNQLNDLKALITMVLTSIYIAAGAIAIGTPVAAILVWRHRAKLLPKATPAEKHEEAKLVAAGSEADRQTKTRS